ncbi:MAG TPA: hypothetical protein VK689_14295, partial [Armatimonadota bacterium]|nr:hypothetical protein [Armatimonadota bacterium]
MQGQAAHFAARLAKEAGSNPTAQVRRAFELAFSRPARPEELRVALEFLQSQGRQIEADARAAGKERGNPRDRALADLCLVLLNSNEFFYLN